MLNPFKRFKAAKNEKPPQTAAKPEPDYEAQSATINEIEAESPEPEDTFTEWRRSAVRGGIERRERNDIYESYSIYGEDGGRLTCRYYHRYPEHERNFDLSYSRTLTFDEFNRRLLSELDCGGLKLSEYNDCISRAEALSGITPDTPAYDGFEPAELDALRGFCEAMDTLTDKTYISEEGIYRCEGGTVAGGERLSIWFRKPIAHELLGTDISGISQEQMYGYDIDNIWIMGVYNRLYERCGSCRVTKLTSEWSLDKESVLIIEAEGLGSISGKLLTAVGHTDDFRRFGFYSLDFSKK